MEEYCELYCWGCRWIWWEGNWGEDWWVYWGDDWICGFGENDWEGFGVGWRIILFEKIIALELGMIDFSKLYNDL
jgi:hypothetical protein